jgi:hypothetical protein
VLQTNGIGEASELADPQANTNEDSPSTASGIVEDGFDENAIDDEFATPQSSTDGEDFGDGVASE